MPPTHPSDAVPAANSLLDALDGHGQGLWDWNLSSGEISYSPEYRLTLGGRDGSAVVSEPDWQARLHPDDRAAALERLQAHCRGELPFFYSEHRLRRDDGRYCWVAARGRVIARSENGTPLRMLGSLLDIDANKLDQSARNEGERRFRLLFDNAPIGLSRQSLQRRLLDVNQAYCELLGFSKAALLNMHSHEFTFAGDRGQDELTLRALMNGTARTIRQQKRYVAADGSLVPVQVDVSLARDEHGEPQYFITQVQDVRERHRHERELREAQELAQTTLASMTDAVLRIDIDGRIDFCNNAALRLLGHERTRDIEGRQFGEVVALFAEHSATPLADPVTQVLRGNGDTLPPVAHLRNLHGDRLPVDWSLSPLRTDDGRLLGCVCVLHDLSHTRLLSEQLIHQASHDALTDLPNRRELEAELAHWLSTARLGVSRHTLLYLDLDHFKLINETAGHSVGDRLVRELAGQLRRALPNQAVLARTGGDEFAVLLPNSSLDDARQIGSELLRTIAAADFEHNGRSYKLAASIGISIINSETVDANTVLAEADTACYIAKRHGGDRCQIYAPGDAAVRQAFTDSSWASRVQQALEAGDVLLYGQHIEPMRSDERPGVEVLIRVRDAAGALQRPIEFLTAAERYGLSGHVDRWVVENTLAALAAGLQRRGELPFAYASVNLTAHSASDPAFADFLFDALARHAFPPQQLRFEITEGTALRNFSAARTLVARLRAYGCRILLDDFGSGFTSFDYLRQMPVDGLKIDMAYTDRLADDPLNQTIVESICRIGKALKLEIIAEGVEEASTLETLRRLGADYAQGHLFHAASPLDALLAG
ncbi:PAS domain-containing protein [Solimonas terrae]|uniref:EAL domain-containing protein n=1 Tax=Solimonas terrae TaxID=1396819 RepID=A0A6M2BSC8_9GAMM|nr:PAS domain-containing protein [Solimonas terrae]NGY05532.1 EAL domain-containing protein [Solimonas terrae]